jgi:hypothetical protein
MLEENPTVSLIQRQVAHMMPALVLERSDMRYLIISVLISALLLLSVAAPAGAVLQQYTYLGTVTALDPVSESVTIRAESEYGCAYPAGGGAPVCSFSPITPQELTGTSPDVIAFSRLIRGDKVVVSSLGAPGIEWVGIARVVAVPGNENWEATDIIGDPATIPVPLIADYGFSYETTPDCNKCTGAVCTALSARVNLTSSGMSIKDQSMNTGQSFTYSGRNDASSVEVIFLGGQAAASLCPGKAGVAGPQPISNFIIHVNPPIGLVTQIPVSTMPTAEGIAAKVTPGTTPAPTKAGILPFTCTGGILVLIALYHCRTRDPVTESNQDNSIDKKNK